MHLNHINKNSEGMCIVFLIYGSTSTLNSLFYSWNCGRLTWLLPCCHSRPFREKSMIVDILGRFPSTVAWGCFPYAARMSFFRISSPARLKSPWLTPTDLQGCMVQWAVLRRPWPPHYHPITKTRPSIIINLLSTLSISTWLSTTS